MQICQAAKRVNTQTANLLFSLLPTVTSESHRVWLKEPLLGTRNLLTANHGVAVTAAFPHLLLSTQLHSLPCCWYYISKAPHSADTTEMLQSAKHSRNIGLKVCLICENESPTLSRKQNPTLSGAPRQLSKLCRKILQETGEETKCSCEQGTTWVFNHYKKSVWQRGGTEPASYLLWKSYISGMFPKRTSFLFLKMGGKRMTMAGLSISAL